MPPIVMPPIKLAKLNQEQVAKLLPLDDLIYLGYRGSIAHGTYQPAPDSADDKDVLGVFIAPLEHYFGFGRQDTYERCIEEWDAVSYELRKFVGLLLKGNPNVLGSLWLPPKLDIYVTEYWAHLCRNRDIFVSKSAYYSFCGYAHGQFHRMMHHTFHGRMGARRRDIVIKFGYDTKNASHLIRLLKMGIEFLTTGEMRVDRAGIDNEELLAIKRGEWTLEEVKGRAELLFKLAEEAFVRSTLPVRPDRDRAEKLVMEILESCYM